MIKGITRQRSQAAFVMSLCCRQLWSMLVMRHCTTLALKQVVVQQQAGMVRLAVTGSLRMMMMMMSTHEDQHQVWQK
jgi:hypothetical protein